MTEKEKSTCERCGLEKEIKQYKPNLGKHPGKTVNVCDDCAGKDNKLIAVEEPVEVPDIEPAVPTEKVEDVPIKKFEAVPPEPIQISTPKNAPDVTESPHPMLCVQHGGCQAGEQTNKVCGFTCPKCEEKPVCTEPISREDIRKKLADCEKDADTLKESKQRVLAQAEQVNSKLREVQKMINITNVRIANYRDLLGDKG